MLDTPIRTVINPLQPGAYSYLDASALQAAERFSSGTVVALVGAAKGGELLKPMFFRGPGPAKEVLRGGPLLDMVRFTFGGGAGLVCALRVGPAVQATKLVAAATSGNFLTLTARDYGAWTNGIKYAVAADNVFTINYTNEFGVTYTETHDGGAASTAAQVAAVITANSKFVTAAAADPLGEGTAKVTPETALAGGADGTTLDAQGWLDGLEVLETQDVSIIVPATGDASVHALVAAHCDALSAPLARRERTMVTGGVLGESPDQALDRASNLRSMRTQIVYPGHYDFDASGELTLYDPFYTAAKIAGMHAALPDPAFSLTHRQVPIVDVERRLSTVQDGEIDRLLGGQVTPIAPADGDGFWVVDSLATYNLDGAFADFHKARTADHVARRARTTLEAKFVGGKTLAGSQDSIKVAATSLLRDLMQEEIIRGYLTPTVAQGPNQRTWQVSLPVILPDTTKFIMIQVALQPGGAASVDAGVTTAGALS